MPRAAHGRYSRAAIEKLRATIDTRSAIKELHIIGLDPSTPANARVKALGILLDKTMPTISERDIHVYNEQPAPLQLLQNLVAMLGEDTVRERWPDLMEKLMPRVIDSEVSDHLHNPAEETSSSPAILSLPIIK